MTPIEGPMPTPENEKKIDPWAPRGEQEEEVEVDEFGPDEEKEEAEENPEQKES